MSFPTSTVTQRLHRIQILTYHLAKDLLAGAYHSAFKGKGMEFEEVREYIPGDEVRHIDWNVTARMQHPYIKTFREEREITVVLLVDVSASVYYGTTALSKADYIAELAASLAFSATRNGDKVGAIFFSDQVEKVIPARKGFQHVMHIIQDMLTLNPKSKQSQLAPALHYLGKLYHKPCICFILSDFFFAPEIKLLTLVAQKHDLIAFKIQDPSEERFPIQHALTQIRNLETGETYIIDWKQATLSQPLQHDLWKTNKSLLKKIGITTAQFLTSSPYLPILQSFFQSRARRVPHGI